VTSKKKKKGICCICGEMKTLTFEHVPPKSAFNNKPIYVQKFSHLMDRTSYVYGKKMKNNKGNGDYTLCKSCNNNTGDWYARDFADFAIQGMQILKEEKSSGEMIKFKNLKIKPLNVFKEIIAMFLSADKTGYLRSIEGLTDFLLIKDNSEFPRSLKIFMYCTLSSYKRFLGYSIIGGYPNAEIKRLSEINFEPFGYILAEESTPPYPTMTDITNFIEYEYDEVTEIEIELPYLKVLTPIIGLYNI
jgi:hypothetical protein